MDLDQNTAGLQEITRRNARLYRFRKEKSFLPPKVLAELSNKSVGDLFEELMLHSLFGQDARHLRYPQRDRSVGNFARPHPDDRRQSPHEELRVVTGRVSRRARHAEL